MRCWRIPLDAIPALSYIPIPFPKLSPFSPDAIPYQKGNPMGLRKANAIRLDFDDLVKELDDFEQDIRTLQERIDQLITNAREKPIEAVAREGDMGTT